MNHISPNTVYFPYYHVSKYKYFVTIRNFSTFDAVEMKTLGQEVSVNAPPRPTTQIINYSGEIGWGEHASR